jgi:hypothetical protein
MVYRFIIDVENYLSLQVILEIKRFMLSMG